MGSDKEQKIIDEVIAKFPAPPRERALPDPFSRDNADLVSDEVELEYLCPCCLDRQAQREMDAYEHWYMSEQKKEQTS